MNMDRASKDNTLEYYRKYSDKLALEYESADVKDLHSLLLKELLKQGMNQSLKVLDLACGTGRESAFLLEHGLDVTGIDGSKELIILAQKIHPGLCNRLFQAIFPSDLLPRNFAAYPFDAVISIAALMHLTKADIEKTIEKCSGLLKSRGLLIISVCINRPGLDSFGLDAFKRRFTLLSPAEWQRIIQARGFKVLYEKKSSDGLARQKIEWLTVVCEKKL
jgi:SAM-dependent methyltransferase